MILPKAGRITKAENGPSHHCNGSAEPPSTAPIRRALRGPRAHRGRREGSAACLDESHSQTSRSPRGRPSARQGRAAWTHTRGFPSSSPQCCSRARSRLPSRAPTSAQRAVGTAASLPGAGATARCSKRGSKTKGKGILLASFLPAGRNRAQDLGYTARLQREWGPRRASPPPKEPLWEPELWVSQSPPRGELGPLRDKPWERARSGRAVPTRPRGGD